MHLQNNDDTPLITIIITLPFFPLIVDRTWDQTMQSFGTQSTPLCRNFPAGGGKSDATNVANSVVEFSFLDWKNTVGGL